MHPESRSQPTTSTIPGILLGLGLGGFVDGILLHQILHWHNMASARVPATTVDGIQYNMRWDGFFHAGVWLLTLVGVYGLLRDALTSMPQDTLGPGNLLDTGVDTTAAQGDTTGIRSDTTMSDTTSTNQ